MHFSSLFFCYQQSYLSIYWTDFHDFFTKWKVFARIFSIWSSFPTSSWGVAMATNFMAKVWQNCLTLLHLSLCHSETDWDIALRIRAFVRGKNPTNRGPNFGSQSPGGHRDDVSKVLPILERRRQAAMGGAPGSNLRKGHQPARRTRGHTSPSWPLRQPIARTSDRSQHPGAAR